MFRLDRLEPVQSWYKANVVGERHEKASEQEKEKLCREDKTQRSEDDTCDAMRSDTTLLFWNRQGALGRWTLLPLGNFGNHCPKSLYSTQNAQWRRWLMTRMTKTTTRLIPVLLLCYVKKKISHIHIHSA